MSRQKFPGWSLDPDPLHVPEPPTTATTGGWLVDENVVLLRRLDAWKEGDNAGPLIRWSAAHLRGELAASSPVRRFWRPVAGRMGW